MHDNLEDLIVSGAGNKVKGRRVSELYGIVANVRIV